ncbi:Spc98 family-domain-containing protein [Cladochytrium replicatum]|nr:Spc98 family-domain-containing protein [Cladochytrium replicatum]
MPKDEVDRLIRLHLRGEDLNTSSLQRYCMNLLSSHIQPTFTRDAESVANQIKKKLIRTDPTSVAGVSFSNLNSKLSNSRLSKVWAVLHFLLSMSDTTEDYEYIPAPHFSVHDGLAEQEPLLSQHLENPMNSNMLSNIQSNNYYYNNSLQHSDGIHIANELSLVREVLYSFQGISGTQIAVAESSKFFNISSQMLTPLSTRSLMANLCELGELLIFIKAFANEHVDNTKVGLISQSFCAMLLHQLSEYFKLIAVLDSKCTYKSDNADTLSVETKTQSFKSVSGSDITLRQLSVWTYEPLQQMRILAAICDTSRGLSGSALLSQMYQYYTHGDPTVERIVSKILKTVSQPLFGMIRLWMFEGELEDPFNEFFVVPRTGIMPLDKNNNVSISLRPDVHNLWKHKYVLRAEHIPKFLNKSTAKKIFLTGKNLNFIRYSCGESAYSLPNTPSLNLKAFCYEDSIGLEEAVETAYNLTCSTLMTILFEKFSLYEHFSALRKYVLLSQGDFALCLMDLISDSLSKSASTLYKHNLTGALESALRNSSGQWESPNVLRRLDVRLLEISHNDVGWDIFIINYILDDPPLNAIFTSNVMVQYGKLFRFLWKLKHVEYVLAKDWSASITLKNNSADYDSSQLHKIHLFRYEMLHFLRELLQFLTFEVIERSWQEFDVFLKQRSGSLDDLCAAHVAYLNQIVTRGFLVTSINDNESLFHIVNGLLDVIIDYTNNCAKLYTKIEEHHWTKDNDSMPPSDESNYLSDNSDNLFELQNLFKDSLKVLLKAIKMHPDENLKDLSVRLNYNDVYGF